MKKEITQLQQKMAEMSIDYYLVPTSDYHHSEYISNYFKCREYLSGFTGSAGTLLVSQTQAWLWADGRYHIQAQQELTGTGIHLMKDGLTGVPTLSDFLKECMETGQTLGFDGRLYTSGFISGLKRKLSAKQILFVYDKDLVQEIWKDRPKLVAEPVYVYPERYAGTTVSEKIAAYRDYLMKYQADCQLLTSLTDIAWLFNLRGHDVACTPVFLSYAFLSLKEVILFIQEGVLTQEAKEYLQNNGIETRDYHSFYDFVKSIEHVRMLVDYSDLNYCCYQSLSDTNTLLRAAKYTTSAKIIKNDTEIEHTRACHLRDGVYMTKFMYWLKNTIRKRSLSELEAAAYIDQLRLSDDLALDLSFETISAYGKNAAIVHYRPSAESNTVVEAKGMLLVDSGGHYLDGTTDITRTFILGPITEEEKLCYTTTCRSMLHLANAKFLTGCRGSNLDCLAREPMWELGIDFLHGTGHGVGHVLSVHEGPNNFRFRVNSGNLDAVLLPGMITTDEPGIYQAEKFGIRIENELLCKKWKQNQYGQFLEFEYLTYAPIDLDGIEPDLMNEQEKQWLNDYHKKVYEKISPYLSKDERKWLKEYTREI
ncbi:MAG TPA: aminopeptidase P family protein [Candidatus Fimousia stercorigallinarum]|nr:aminopeptidase P family protein [Candidatus Fimousia stercorigallinarum]